MNTIEQQEKDIAHAQKRLRDYKHDLMRCYEHAVLAGSEEIQPDDERYGTLCLEMEACLQGKGLNDLYGTPEEQAAIEQRIINYWKDTGLEYKHA